MTDDILLRIAHLDYGNDAEAHFAALTAIRDHREIPCRLSWIPLEVLSLAGSISAGQITYYGGDRVGVEEAKLIHAFASAVFLVDTARPGGNTSSTASNIELCRMLMALKPQGQEALGAALPFVAWLGQEWPVGQDLAAFCAVALVCRRPPAQQTESSRIFALYTFARAIPVALVTIAAMIWGSVVVVIWLSALAGLVQLFDGYVGTQLKNVRTTWGPIAIGVVQFAVLAWVVFGTS